MTDRDADHPRALQRLQHITTLIPVDGYTRARAYAPHQESALESVATVADDPANRLTALARAVARLSPLHRNHEQFHMDKSEIAAELRRLAREVAA